MKRNNLPPMILAFVVLLSLFLSYIQLFNPQWFMKWLEPDVTETTLTQQNDEYAHLSQFYQSTNTSFEQTLRPFSYYYRLDGDVYWLHANELGQTLDAYLSSRPIEVQSTHLVKDDEEGYFALFSGDYIEINFPTDYPIELLNAYISLPENKEFNEPVSINQIIIPLNENQQVYLANSYNNTYLRGELSEHLTKEELNSFLSTNMDTYIPVERYTGKYQYIYLPLDSFEMESRTYALEQLPQQLYLAQIFPGGSDQSFSETVSGSYIYKTYQYTLDINPKTKRLDYVISRINQGESASKVDQLKNSFQQIQSYEYWSDGLRLVEHSNSLVTYRRFIEGVPIFSAPDIPDYGTSLVYLRGNDGREMARYQTSMLRFKAYIDNIETPAPIESAHELVEIFEELSYPFSQFDYALVGYEWQAEMEEYKKATLIPKWYFSYDDNLYSLDEIQSDDFYDIWQVDHEEEF